MLALILPSCKRREEMSLVLAVQTMSCAWEGASYTHRARYCIFNDSVQGVHKKLGEYGWNTTYHMLRTSLNDLLPGYAYVTKEILGFFVDSKRSR